MVRSFITLFIILHGLVHLWYFTLSQELVAFKLEMGWSGRSWLFSPLLGSNLTRFLAGALYIAVTVVFVIAGAGIFTRAGWARPVLAGAALLSSTLILIFWEGSLHLWIEKGMIGLLINLVLLAAIWALRSPALANLS